MLRETKSFSNDPLKPITLMSFSVSFGYGDAKFKVTFLNLADIDDDPLTN